MQDDLPEDLSFLDVRRMEQGPDDRHPDIPPTTQQVALGFALAIMAAVSIVGMIVWAFHR